MYDPAMLVEDVLTPLPLLGGLVPAVIEGHRSYLGDLPTPECAAVEVAQVALETGNGLKMHCFNAGNVKWSPDWAGYLCMYRCSEVIGGQVQFFTPPHPQTWFRAWLSAPEGMAAQVEFLASRDRYKKAWHQVLTGDPERAVRELGNAGYFTANVDAYARAVKNIYGHVLAVCADWLAGRPTQDDADLAARVSIFVAEAGYDPALRDLRLHEDLAA